MVRCIRHCPSCQSRFIAFAGQQHCIVCIQNASNNNSNSNSNKKRNFLLHSQPPQGEVCLRSHNEGATGAVSKDAEETSKGRPSECARSAKRSRIKTVTNTTKLHFAPLTTSGQYGMSRTSIPSTSILTPTPTSAKVAHRVPTSAELEASSLSLASTPSLPAPSCRMSDPKSTSEVTKNELHTVALTEVIDPGVKSKVTLMNCEDRLGAVISSGSQSKLLNSDLSITPANCSANDEDSQSEGSEAGDDANCTQIEPDEDEVEMPCGEEQVQLDNDVSLMPKPSQDETIVTPSTPGFHDTAKTNEKANTTVCPGVANDDICFICGASLAGLKRRVDHIKRCSKKHGVTAKDVKLNGDDEVFAKNEISSPIESCREQSSNPYAKNCQWHGDASLELKLAGQDEPNGSKQNEPFASKCGVVDTASYGSFPACSAKQTRLSSFFPAQIRNLNAVLVSGARRMAKMAQVAAARKSEESRNAGQMRRFGRRISKMQSYRKRGDCPSYKKIPGTDFVCDGFLYANSAITKNYFLTHFHSDHYGGITKSWNEGTIYCSLPTATLVNQQLRVDKKHIHPLPMMVPTAIESRGKPVTVTLLDANHCPGAVMFLFQVGKRRILHVGDFRWNRSLMLQQAPLKAFALEKENLDELFLDTTYCDPKYTLPSQQEAIQATVEIVRKELEYAKVNRCRTLHVFGAYTIGKERIYISVAEQLGLKVYVDRARHRILSALQWRKERLGLLTTRKEDACIWVVPLGHVNMKKLPEYMNNSSRPFDRIIGYRPTGWSLKPSAGGNIVGTRSHGCITIHSVPYSEHSSFNELLDCLHCLRPGKIVPTVNAGKGAEQVDLLLTALRQKQTMLSFGAMNCTDARP